MRLYLKQLPIYDVVIDHRNNNTFIVNKHFPSDYICKVVCSYCEHKKYVCIINNIGVWCCCNRGKIINVSKYCPEWKLKVY